MSTPAERTVPLDDPIPLRLTQPEVEELWHFLHGDIMGGGIRVQLRQSMGLCPRHTWAYAQVEIELWQQGAGTRAGHQPFDVCVLYEDLLGEAVRRLSGAHLPWHQSPGWTLRATGPCRICSALDHGDIAIRSSRGFAGSNSAVLTAEANAANFTAAWLDRTEAQWRRRVCPACADHASGDVSRLCRPHLMEWDALDADQAARIAEHLSGLQRRVRRLASSMTAAGPASSAADAAGWVEALAWFTGWTGLLRSGRG